MAWRHPEVRSGQRGGDTAGVGRRGGEDGADKRGPCVSEGIEKRRREWKALIKEENVFGEIRQRHAWAEH
jgi:hypothetical protein